MVFLHQAQRPSGASARRRHRTSRPSRAVTSSTTGKASQMPVMPKRQAKRQAVRVMPTQPRKVERAQADPARSVALRKAAVR